MQFRFRQLVTRSALATTFVLAAAGVAVATSVEPPPSSPTVLLGTTQSDLLRASGFDGTGVTVAVIDTGIADVAGFGGKVRHQQNISSAPIQGDQFGHGTFVAGLVHQVAPGSDLISVKLSGANGAVDVSQVIAALRWVVRHKEQYSIDVVNLSFGSDSQQPTAVSPLNYAVQQAWDAGIVVVASAGNLGDRPGTVTKPADDPLIISVGATNENGDPNRSNDDIPSFVSRGPTHDGLSKPDLVAPGSRVVSLRSPGSTIDTQYPGSRVGDTQFRGSGTSFAAPVVAGLAAQLLQAYPNLTPDEVKNALIATAKPVIGDPSAQGAGTVRAQKAFDAAGSGGAANAGATRSSGLGSLDDARGSAVVEVEAPLVTATGTAVEAFVAVDGEHTAEVPQDASITANLGAGDTVDDALGDYAASDLVEPSAWAISAEPTLAVGDVVTAATNTDLALVEGLVPAALAPNGTVTQTSGTTYGGYDGTGDGSGSSWDASRWGASRWGASRWGASRWGASRWGASRWGASRWGAAEWWASRWG
ncbi:MAG: aprX [Thermoleophilia bacterium]|nr:aprX [Thermoleophilia bacterium]